jgi:outer membrane receptor for ferrienterochelin and colicin
MPANAIEKIEIITQPGAEFPATSGGAILNIITNKNAKNYLSATYTNSTSFTSYDAYGGR